MGLLSRQLPLALAAGKKRNGASRTTLDLKQGKHYSCKTVAGSQCRQGTCQGDQEIRGQNSMRSMTGRWRPISSVPDQKWVVDTTCLWAKKLALPDRGDPSVFNMTEWTPGDLVGNALGMAHVHRDDRPGRQLLRCLDHVLMEKHEQLCCMSVKGKGRDNAYAEIYFHTLKVELIHGEGFAARVIRAQAFSNTSN